MAKTKQQKVETLERITDAMKNAGSVVFVNFHGLGVSDTNEMRDTLKEQGLTYLVAKKTLTKRAIEDAQLDGDMPELDGELALAWGDDQVAPAREVNEFAKKHKENLSILGGVFEHRLLGREEMTTIASIPPLQTLYGQFANVINSPIQGLVVALNAVAEKKEA